MKEELIEQLKKGISDSIEFNDDPDVGSWYDISGVIITRTQAELFLKLLQQPTPEEARRKAFDEVREEGNKEMCKFAEWVFVTAEWGHDGLWYLDIATEETKGLTTIELVERFRNR